MSNINLSTVKSNNLVNGWFVRDVLDAGYFWVTNSRYRLNSELLVLPWEASPSTNRRSEACGASE